MFLHDFGGHRSFLVAQLIAAYLSAVMCVWLNCVFLPFVRAEKTNKEDATRNTL